MSHFKLIVLRDKKKDTLDELLMPYFEGGINDCPVDFLEFTECDEPYLLEYEQNKDKYSNLDDFMEDNYSYCYKDEETGEYGTYHNPYGKWDKYVIGGIWADSIVLKNGKKSSSAKIKDIDWIKTKNLNKSIAEKLWDSDISEGYKRLSGIYSNDTKETFLERESFFYSNDIITSDGYWESQRDLDSYFKYDVMSSTNENRTVLCFNNENTEDLHCWAKDFYNNFIKNADPELELIIVDCHI